MEQVSHDQEANEEYRSQKLEASESPKENQEIESEILAEQPETEDGAYTRGGESLSPGSAPHPAASGAWHMKNFLHTREEHSDKHMHPKLYKYATEGKAADFQKTLSDLTNKDSLEQDQFLLRVSPQKNTFLHIAACYGHTDLAENILELCPTLLKMENVEGDTALHVAARAGNLGLVRLFLNKFPDIGYGYALFPTMTNKEGNTALHEALINHHELVAKCLIEAYPRVSYYINEEGKSVLYLAAEAGYVKLVQLMMELERAVDVNENGQELKGKSPVYAAILGRNEDVLKTILTMEPTICGEDEGRTPLHLAVSIGYLQGVCILLGDCKDDNVSWPDRYLARPVCSSYSYVRDNSGDFPIHIASSKGYIEIMEELLQSCPDSIELLNNDGQNILHVAANCGKDNVVRYVLKKYKLLKLINQKDNEGDTPLHLATKCHHPNVVSTLTWDKRINLKLVNNKSLTALDLTFADDRLSLHMILTWITLKSAGAKYARALNVLEHRNIYNRTQSQQRRNKVDVTSDIKEIFKDQVNTLLLMATLIVTVTFTAGFTMPGGFNNSNPNQGMATFLMKHMFHMFVICNALAMYISILVAVLTLTWATTGDLNMTNRTLILARPLLRLALVMMSLAFMAGIYLAVSDLAWLANVVLVMGIIFPVIIVVLYVIFFPYRSSHPIVRYITYYPFRLLAFASERHG